MREIKFRGRSLYEEKQWVYGLVFKSGSEGQWTEIQTANGATCYVDPETIGQYTGLKDENGKEIYEGDIVETVTASGNPFGTIDVVRYQDGGFKLVDETDSLLPIYIGDKEVISIEVIGNIYEHPYLLEVHHD